MNEEIVRVCKNYLVKRFLDWRSPPVELPPDSLIEEVVRFCLSRGKLELLMEVLRDVRFNCSDNGQLTIDATLAEIEAMK